MAFLPEDFDVPTLVAGQRFRIRPITVNDVVKDYDAVMSSRERLWDRFGERWGWPAADLTYEQALVDLGWLQKEGQLRRSFTYAVLTSDEERLLGRVHILPPGPGAQADAGVVWWIRSDQAGTPVERELAEFVREWTTATWPFKTVCEPGVDVTWREWDAR
ncbi:GNAT family N-acetyltransferase [Thermomonospora amylolytica]|uniref:GNAT family N-acetyltransferase n=1 Tax=Thermomonospora amylolytica TaxID=1411117 RepID=UPI000E6D0FFB|nr:GNAT family N-acetyltransferase [Thermomonospora amylolytica]